MSLFVLFVLLLSGCSSPSSDKDSQEDLDAWLSSPTEDTDDPGDVSQGQRGLAGWHVHDYWGGQTEMVLLDQTVPVTILHNHMLDEPPREQHLHGCDSELVSDSQGGSTEFTLPPGQIVPPGTASMTFTLSWDDPTITGVRLRFKASAHAAGHADGEHDHVEGFSDLGPMENGVPVTVPVGPEMADLGHDMLSHWRFLMCADSGQNMDLAEGTVRAEFVAHRAEELTPDPPHPDHWQNATSLRLGALEWSGTGAGAGNKGDGVWHRIPLDEGAIVPPLTDRVTVTVHHNTTSEVDATPPSFLVYWKDSTTWEWDYRMVEPVETGESVARFEIPIDSAAMVDSHYATVSNWDIWLRITSGTTQDMPSDGGTWTTPHTYSGDVHAVAKAHRFQA